MSMEPLINNCVCPSDSFEYEAQTDSAVFLKLQVIRDTVVGQQRRRIIAGRAETS